MTIKKLVSFQLQGVKRVFRNMRALFILALSRTILSLFSPLVFFLRISFQSPFLFSSLLSLLFVFIITIVLEVLTSHEGKYDVFTKVFKHSSIFLIIERWIMKYCFRLVGRRVDGWKRGGRGWQKKFFEWSSRINGLPRSRHSRWGTQMRKKKLSVVEDCRNRIDFLIHWREKVDGWNEKSAG